MMLCRKYENANLVFRFQPKDNKYLLQWHNVSSNILEYKNILYSFSTL